MSKKTIKTHLDLCLLIYEIIKDGYATFYKEGLLEREVSDCEKCMETMI